MKIKVILNSACDLMNVNRHSGSLQPYAVVRIDSGGRCSTKIDVKHGVNPVWNEKFIIPLPSTSRPETAFLYIDVVHANTTPGTKSVIIGSAKLPLQAAIDKIRSKGNASLNLNLETPSGQTYGSVQIQIQIIESFDQQDRNKSPQPQPKLQPQQTNQPGNSMPLPTMMPPYYPFMPSLLGAAMNTSRMQVEMAMKMYMLRRRGIFQGPQVNYMGMLNNNGIFSNGTNFGTDSTGTFTDFGGLGSSGLDFGAFGNGGLDMGMLANGGFGGLDMSGMAFGGLGSSFF